MPSRFIAHFSRRCLVPSHVLSALPCLIVSRRFPSLRCHVRASLIVSSLRPSFPLLRRSPPIPSPPWRVFSPLIYSVAARLNSRLCLAIQLHLDTLRFLAHRCFAVSRQFTDLPLKSMASPCRSDLIPSTPFHLCPCRSVSPRRHDIAILIVSSLSFSAPRPAISALVMSEPFNSVTLPSRLLSQTILAFPLRLHSHRPASIRCLFGSFHLRALPCHCRSVQSLSRQFSAFASPFGSLPCHCLSAHRRPLRSWPFLCASSHCLSFPFRFLAPRISPLLRHLKSSPLQSAPSRFFASPFSAKQGGSNPLPLVSLRFWLCSAMPSRFGWIHFDASPWLLIASHALPFRIRSDPCASAGLVSKSARFSSCPSFAVSSPCSSLRVVSPQRRAVAYRVSTVRCHLTASLVSAELIHCHSTQHKSGLITSVSFRIRSM